MPKWKSPDRFARVALLLLLFSTTTHAQAPESVNKFRPVRLSIVFPSIEGIEVNASVYRDGVRVGRVTDIDLRDEGGVLVSLSIDAERKLTHRYLPRIQTNNLTGEARLEFVRGSPAELTAIFGEDRGIVDAAFRDGEFLTYGITSLSIHQAQDDLQDSIESFRRASESIQRMGDSMNQFANELRMVTDDAAPAMSADRFNVAMEELEAALGDVRELIGDPELQENLKRSSAQLPEVLDKVDRTTVQFERMAADSQELIEKAHVMAEAFGEIGASIRDSMQSFPAAFFLKKGKSQGSNSFRHASSDASADGTAVRKTASESRLAWAVACIGTLGIVFSWWVCSASSEDEPTHFFNYRAKQRWLLLTLGLIATLLIGLWGIWPVKPAEFVAGPAGSATLDPDSQSIPTASPDASIQLRQGNEIELPILDEGQPVDPDSIVDPTSRTDR